MLPNLIEATHEKKDIDDRATVVIVGAGAGGPVAALALAEAGIDTILLEEGGWHPPEFYRDAPPMDVFKYMYRDFGMTTAFGKSLVKDPAVPFPLGKGVGGTTAVNSGTCFRTPEKVLASWESGFGLEIDRDALEAGFQQVDDYMHVEPVADEVLGPNAELFKKGVEKLGWSGGPLRRNAAGCRGSGRCAFGCPTNAKQGTQVSYVPRALMAGARLYTDVRVEKLETDGSRITGVRGSVMDRERNRPVANATFKADAVILAAGAVGTPVILQKNGIAKGNPHLGANLRLHPGIRVCALMDHEVNGWKGVPQGYYVDEFWEELGIMFEGVFVPPGFAIPIFPSRNGEMEMFFDQYPNLAAFGAMVKDTSSGTVRAGRTRTDIRYRMNQNDKTSLVEAVKKACQVFFEVGALEVYPAIYGHAVLKNPDDLAKIDPKKIKTQHLEPMAFHPMGTARMAADPKLGVTDNDGRVHGSDNLYVADSSLFPTCLGVNPMQSIMGFSKVISDRLAERLS